MSAEATAWAWGHAQKTESQGQLLVLLALAEHTRPGGECFPNRRTIARMCGYGDKSLSSVTKHIKAIEALGLIERDPRFEKENEGRQTSNNYLLRLDLKGEAPSGAVEHTPSAPEPTPPSAPGSSQEPGTSNPVQTVAADVKIVYDHHLAVFQPKTVPKLGPSLIRQIEKGLKEYEAQDLCVAIDGLFEWRKQKPGKNSLGAIFDTYPGGKPLVEQIGFFISQAKSSTGVGRSFPSADRAIVAEKQRLVQRGHRLQQNEEAVKQAKDAEAWLREHGIETVPNDGGTPTFRPRRAEAAGGEG